MRAAACWSVPGASTSQVAGVTCVTTPVPHVQMEGRLTVPAVTRVSSDRGVNQCVFVWETDETG